MKSSIQLNPSYDNHPMFHHNSVTFKQYATMSSEQLVIELIANVSVMAHFRTTGDMDLAQESLASCNTIVHFLNSNEGWNLKTYASVGKMESEQSAGDSLSTSLAFSETDEYRDILKADKD